MEIKEVQDAVKAGVQPVVDQVKDLQEKVAKLEAVPAVAAAPAIVTRSSEYKGYRLSKQLASARNIASKDAHLFPVLANDEKAEEMAKFYIDLVKVLKFRDIEAAANLKDFFRKTTLAEGAAANGGYLVPEEYANDIVQLARNSSYILRFGTVIPMNTDTLNIPAELTRGSTTWVSEGTQKTASEPTFSTVALSAKKMMNLAVANNELIADSAIDIAGILNDQFAYTMGIELDNQAINGTGDPVSGVGTAKAGYSVIAAAGASFSTISASDLSLAISKLEEGYLAGSRFLAGRLAMHYIRSLKDSNGRPIFAEIGGTVPRTVYEFPIHMTEKIANTDGGSKLAAVFGNFKYFYIGQRKSSMQIELDPYSLFDYDQTRFRMVTRWGLAVAQANAFARIMTAAA